MTGPMSCADGRVIIHVGDCRETLAAMPEASVDCIVTSPPYYGLRDYGHDGQIGLEPTPDAYVAQIVAVMREARRVLKPTGTLWLNLGDSYAANRSYQVPPTKWANLEQGQPSRVPDGLKPKDLLGIPWRAAFALQADGWWLRSEIIWHKPNPMPESVTDRPTKSHEQVFLLTAAERYWYDKDAIREQGVIPAGTLAAKGSAERAAQPGVNARPPEYKLYDGFRNARTVWSIATEPSRLSHFALMPSELARRCILAGCPKGGVVLDPFGGGGTTGLTAARHGRRAILCELNPDYAAMARDRIAAEWREPVKPGPVDFGPLFQGAAE